MDVSWLPTLLAAAWLAPLVSFCVILFFGPRMGHHGKGAGILACLAIVTSTVLSGVAMFGVWLPNQGATAAAVHDGGHEGAGEEGQEQSNGHVGGVSDADYAHRLMAASASQAPPTIRFAAMQPEEDTEASLESAENGAGEHSGHADEPNPPPKNYYGDWYSLGKFGKLKLTIGYYIDALTVTMFCMVSLIASCVHIYAVGYMHDELHEPYVDHEVHTADGGHLHRRGRFHRFFQYLSLFSFSMLGIVIAGNVAMVFVFWELVGICSYFLIGFYFERKSASTAANKAFIVNRIGDFGMLIGMMALWASLGTFAFGDKQNAPGETALTEAGEIEEPGIFSLLRSKENDYRLVPPPGMVAEERRMFDEASESSAAAPAAGDSDEHSKSGHWLLLVAGVGIFCGCVGKSAQFPLHTWLPDAMEGPTPVSALVHSATMVAAGVYLVGRFYPAFSPEALLVIAIIGCITLSLAATIAITAVDIKRVLAYSTVSQLGYMMLALGLGGWVAGMFHLITHAFFKSLLFLCSGSVIHAVHTNDMTEMGGLRKKMPITAYTMLVGCLAIIGAGIPVTHFGLSGYYSKDAIIEQALSYARHNGGASWLFFVLPTIGAAITAFYMFRLWYMTFAGTPRNMHRYDHAHESPAVMTRPLILLAIFAIGVGWTLPFKNLGVVNLLEQARPVGTLSDSPGVILPPILVPNEHTAHQAENFRTIVLPAALAAFTAAMVGLILATVIYLWRLLDPAEIKQTFYPVYKLLWNKWYFDEIYWAVFVTPVMWLAKGIAQFDRRVIDAILHACAAVCKALSRVVEIVLDKTLVDGSVNTFADWTWDFGHLLHKLQTGSLRQYVLFIVMGTWFMCLAYFAVSFVLMS